MKPEIKIFDNPKNVNRLLRGFYVSLAVLLAADFFIHKHPEFPWAGRHQFFAAYGFVSCVLVITIAKVLRFFVKRREAYYDD
jgi:hypothetical protein